MQPEDIINTPIKPEDFTSKSISADDAGMSDDLELDNEIDPIGDIDFDETDNEDFGANDDEFDSEIDLDKDLDIDIDIEDEPSPETNFSPADQIIWTTQTQDDNTIVSRHKDGFVLMAKRLSAQSGDKHKYISRLSRDGRMIDSGTVWIEDDKDPTEYLQNLSDRILDRGGLAHITKELTDKSKPDRQEEDDSGEGEDLGSGLGGSLDLGGEDDMDFNLDGDLDLDDEDLEIDDEEADIDIEED